MSRKPEDLGTVTRCEQMVPPWIQRMREMSQKHLTEDVVEQIVTAQIDRAKKGDRNAINFVFNQLMGGQALKGAKFTQINYGGESGERPGKALPPKGPARIEAMRRRAEQRRPLADPENEPDLS